MQAGCLCRQPLHQWRRTQRHQRLMSSNAGQRYRFHIMIQICVNAIDGKGGQIFRRAKTARKDQRAMRQHIQLA